MATRPMVFLAPSFEPVEFQRLLDDAATGGGADVVTPDQMNAAIAAAVAPLQSQIDALTARVAALEAAAP